MQLSPDDIELYLKDYGWDFSLSGPDIWSTGWQGDNRSYPLIIKLTETWLSFSVAPLLRLGPSWSSYPEVSLKLLELNHDCQLVKLGIDEFGDVTLSAQLLTSCVDFGVFSDYLGVIGYYADKIYDCLEAELGESEHFLESMDVSLTQ